jgi:hypothetical protein
MSLPPRKTSNCTSGIKFFMLKHGNKKYLVYVKKKCASNNELVTAYAKKVMYKNKINVFHI